MSRMNSTQCSCNSTEDIPVCNNCTTIYLDNSTIIVLHALYVAVVVVGVIGNMMTFTVTIMQKSMRRSIHIYVFNLAVCDMFILLFYVPNEMSRIENQARYVWGPVMCKITYAILPIAIHSTSGMLLAITLDRARGVLRPFDWRADSRRRATIIVPAVWILSVFLSMPNIVYSQLYPWNGGVVCTADWRHSDRYWYAMFVITFLLPLIIIFLLHILMIVYVTREQVLVQQKTHKTMMKMTASIVIIFTICTGAQHIYFFVYKYLGKDMSPKTDGILFFGSNFVVSLQAAVNPIIYGTFRKDFNAAFKHLLVRVGKVLRICHVSEPSHLTQNFSSLLNIHMLSLAFVIRKKLQSETLDLEKNYGNSTYVPNDVPDVNRISLLECKPETSLEDILRCPSLHLDFNNSTKYESFGTLEADDASPEIAQNADQEEITELLNDLRNTDVLETFARKSRLSADYLTTRLDLQNLSSSYQNIGVLDFLQWFRGARETDL